VDTIRDIYSIIWTALNTSLITLAGTPVSVVTVMTVLVMLIVAHRGSTLGQAAFLRFARSRGVGDEGSVGTVMRLLHYSIVAVALVVALQTVGVQLDALLTFGAVFAVGIGLALQGIAQNFVSGIILLLEQSIRPRDVVEVDAQLVISVNGDRRIVPNSALVQATVRNFTMRSKAVRLKTEVGVAYATPPAHAREVLLAAARAVEDRLEEREPVVQFKAFGDSALLFDVFLWIGDPWLIPVMRDRLNQHIWEALAEAKISIPFPQRDLHVKGAVSVVDHV
jgi:potassium-dependent mechanosensitive channel